MQEESQRERSTATEGVCDLKPWAMIEMMKIAKAKTEAKPKEALILSAPTTVEDDDENAKMTNQQTN
jgi:hypothetical protein